MNQSMISLLGSTSLKHEIFSKVQICAYYLSGTVISYEIDEKNMSTVIKIR